MLSAKEMTEEIDRATDVAAELIRLKSGIGWDFQTMP